jgi:hypothetical protein
VYLHKENFFELVGGTMNKIFMTRMKDYHDKNLVKLAVFLKGNKEHVKDLMGFLKNQDIDCSKIPQDQRKVMQEFAYFDEGFLITIMPSRWSFYELKSYIQTYTDTCEEDFVLRDTLFHEPGTYDEGLFFNDRFYVQLAKEIEKCEELYYQENMSIGLFMSVVLKLLRQNLQLYWAASKLMDIQTRKVNYLNHDPPSLPRKDILKTCTDSPSKLVIKAPVEFCDEHIADFFLKPSPFSPKASVINKFLAHVVMRIDAFIYGHLAHKTETIRLKSEIAELKKQHQPSMSVNPEREQKTREKLQLLLLGDSHLSNNQILPLFSKFGFGRENLELETEYEKYRTFDTNNLLAVRSRYDGILLGPMPHSMKGDLTIGDGLIVQMQREPERYPPFVVVRDKKGDLKISKSSLKNAIKDLVSLIEKVEKYVQ